MLRAYRPLLTVPGARRFVVGASFGRVAVAMFGISVVVMVARREGSYALAGSVSAVGLLSFALSAPVIGGFVDRYGQRRVALPLVVVSTLMLAAMVACSLTSAPVWTLYVTYALSGGVASLGTMSRARWNAAFHGEPESLHVAMSFEQVLDELGFVIAPALAVVLSTTFLPETGAIVAGLGFFVGTLLFCSARESEPEVVARVDRPRGVAVTRPGLLVVAAVMTLTGVLFGSNEVVTVAVADAAGHENLASVVLGLFALGSAISGLAFGTRTFTSGVVTRLVVGVSLMALLELPVLLASGNLWALAVVMLVAGVATAPTLITSMGLAQRLVPPAMLNEGLTVVLTGLVVGVSSGSALGGAAVEALGPRPAYAVPVLASIGAVVLALLGARSLVRAEQAVGGAGSTTEPLNLPVTVPGEASGLGRDQTV